MPAEPDPWAISEFGRFKVVRYRRELLADGQPVPIGGRAFDMLLALIDANGTVVGTDDLMRRVWPDRLVEEHNDTLGDPPQADGQEPRGPLPDGAWRRGGPLASWSGGAATLWKRWR